MRADMQVLPISVVIPVRNESSTLDELFSALLALLPRPAEVVFVDTGSTDASVGQISAWIELAETIGLAGQLCRHPGGFPGAARNTGVAAASQEWIAFLDAGITPMPGWLGALWLCREQHQSEVVYGVCRFTSESRLGQMLCAASYSTGRMLPVLPASLFHRKLFQKIGGFEVSLRSGEDILWRNALVKAGVLIPTCDSAIVEYRHFPPSIIQAMRKWFIYERSAVVAGVGGRFRTAILWALLAICVAMPLAFQVAGPLLLAYLLARGVVDPLRRSSGKRWWQAWWQVALEPFIVLLLDLASALGRLSVLLGGTGVCKQTQPAQRND